MPGETPSSTLDRELATKIVAAYVRRNQIGSDQLAALISTVHQAFSGFGKPLAEVGGERTPAVPIRRSVHSKRTAGARHEILHVPVITTAFWSAICAGTRHA